jgi:hypothetical protein
LNDISYFAFREIPPAHRVRDVQWIARNIAAAGLLAAAVACFTGGCAQRWDDHPGLTISDKAVWPAGGTLARLSYPAVPAYPQVKRGNAVGPNGRPAPCYGHVAKPIWSRRYTDGEIRGKAPNFGPEFSVYSLYRDPLVQYRD